MSRLRERHTLYVDNAATKASLLVNQLSLSALVLCVKDSIVLKLMDNMPERVLRAPLP
jgi:hypothetical protein